VSAIEDIERHDVLPGTSAEPALDPRAELRICRAIVLADVIEDIPLLTPAELEQACALIDSEPSKVRDLVQSRKETRHAFLHDALAYRPREVTAAALVVEEAVQDLLWHLGGPGSTIAIKRWAMELWDAQWQAHRAVFAKTGSRMLAKDAQRKAARGRSPLTVCVGRKLRRLPEDELRRHAPDVLEHGWLEDGDDNIVWIGGDGAARSFSILPSPVRRRNTAIDAPRRPATP
jgi:hypothetical protein